MVGHDDIEDDGTLDVFELEVCLPVRGDGDAVLPGGRFAATEVSGDAARPPQLLSAYGAVSQWAHERGEVLTGPPLEVQLGGGALRMGWLTRPRGSGTGAPERPVPRWSAP